MSLLDGITVLCEGIDGGLDARLLEATRQTLTPSVPRARAITIRPAGSKTDFRPAIRAHLRLLPSVPVFAIRDRDFLSATLVADRRAKCATEQEAWPLSRHSIESYLVDPVFVKKVVQVADVDTIVAATAQDRLWYDAGRATLERAAWEARRERPQLKKAVRSEQDVIRAVTTLLAGWKTALDGIPTAQDAEAVCRGTAADFQSEELWTRVDGPGLLKDLAKRLGRPELREVLSAAAVLDPPSALVAELRKFLTSLRV